MYNSDGILGFIIYRRIYDADLRKRLAERYTTVTKHDCNLANEWWDKFCRLSPLKLKIAKGIIEKNKFDSDALQCNDEEVLEILRYYTVSRNDTEK